MPNLIIPRGTIALEPLKKTERAARAIWQPRDVEILRAVLEHRFLSRPLLAGLFPPDPSKAPRAAFAAWRSKNAGGGEGAPAARRARLFNLDRRLRLLSEAGFLDRFLLGLDGALAYGLTKEGERFLRSRQPELPMVGIDLDRQNRRVARWHVEHTLVVARFRLALERALVESPGTTLAGFVREGEETRRSFGERSINPDAFFVLAPEGRPRLGFFLEADRDTASMPRLGRKILDYAWLLRRPAEHPIIKAAEVDSFAVLFVVAARDDAADNRRASAIINAAAELEHGRARFFVTCETNYARAYPNVLAEIWLRADADPDRDEGDQRRAIVPTPLAKR